MASRHHTRCPTQTTEASADVTMSILNTDEPATAKKKRSRPTADGADSAKPDVDVIKSVSQPQPKKDKIKRRRLHVAGLPAISEQEAVNRFQSFGKVVGVDGLGKLDENGEFALPTKRAYSAEFPAGVPLRYAFIDIETTRSKLSQCMQCSNNASPDHTVNAISYTGMNLLSGSVWKGSTLRIAEAKRSRLEKYDACLLAASRQS